MSLLHELQALGEDLAESGETYVPSPNEVPRLLGALIQYTDTGSFDAPSPPKAADQPKTPEQSRISELEAELSASLEREKADEAALAAINAPSSVPPVTPPSSGEGNG